jgi:EmrB/QacA subfamily drug resistance transporter
LNGNGSVGDGGRRKWFVLSTVSVGTFMATLDGSIVNVSLPTIARELGVGISDIEWVVVAYLLTIGALLLTFGRLGEVLGFKKVYLAGFVLFTAASALCGAAQGVLELTVFRVFQGIGAGMLQAMGPAIVTATFPGNERGKALGINAISVSAGLAIGPTIGGIITEWLSWRWIFFINVPIGVFGVLWASSILHDARRETRQRFDPVGAVLLGGALFALLLALVEGETWGWGSPAILGLLAAFVVLGSTFAVAELRMSQPLYDLRLFRIRSFWAGNVSLIVAFVSLFVATFLMPFFLQRGQGYSVLDTGLLLTPLPLATLVVAPFSGALSDRIGPRFLSTLGLAVVGLGLLSLTQLDAGASPFDIAWRLAVIGVGQGLFNSPNNSSILGSVPRPRLGTASGTVAQMRVTGQVLGIAVGAAILAGRISSHAEDLARQGLSRPVVQRDALILAVHDAFYVAAAICVLGIITSLIRGRRETPKGSPSEGGTPHKETPRPGEDRLVAGLALAYLAGRIESANGDSPRLIRAAANLVEADGHDPPGEERARALRAGREIIRPLSRTLLLSYLTARGETESKK